jgi:hypothetical protein
MYKNMLCCEYFQRKFVNLQHYCDDGASRLSNAWQHKLISIGNEGCSAGHRGTEIRVFKISIGPESK